MTRRNRLWRHTFRVADFRLEVVFDGTNDGDNIGLLPSFVPFIAESDNCDAPLLFTLTVKGRLDAVETIGEIGCFDTGNGDIIVHRTADGGLLQTSR